MAEIAVNVSTITRCTSAKLLDFVMVTEEGKVNKKHGIQVSLATRKRKCSNSNFFKEGDANYIYLLTPEPVDGNVLNTEITRDNAFKRAFTESHLRIIDPSTVLTSEQIKLLRKYRIA